MGYLGLALLESGDPARARPWFEQAGSAAMLARCDALLADLRGREVALRRGRVGGRDALPVDVDVEDTGVAPVAPPAPRAVEPEPPPRVPAPAPPSGPASSRAGLRGARTVAVPPEVFAVEGGILHVAVRGELVCRLDGLFAVRGAVTARPR